MRKKWAFGYDCVCVCVCACACVYVSVLGSTQACNTMSCQGRLSQLRERGREREWEGEREVGRERDISSSAVRPYLPHSCSTGKGTSRRWTGPQHSRWTPEQTPDGCSRCLSAAAAADLCFSQTPFLLCTEANICFSGSKF